MRRSGGHCIQEIGSIGMQDTTTLSRVRATDLNEYGHTEQGEVQPTDLDRYDQTIQGDYLF